MLYKEKRAIPNNEMEEKSKLIFESYSQLAPRPPRSGYISGLELGNKKIGKRGTYYDNVLVWNLPPRITCPGFSSWCEFGNGSHIN